MAIRNGYERFPGGGGAPLAGAKPARTRLGVLPRPAQTAGKQYSLNRQETYELMYQYYANTAFDELSQWAHYRKRYGLYKYTRGIFNPVTRLVNFYVAHVYPGALTIDGERTHDDDTISAIPLALGTAPALRQGLTWIWKWSNWQVKKDQMVFNTALYGNTLVEVVDDVARSRVSLRVVHPGYVPEFELDSDGNLTYYKLEYPIYDRATETTSLYRKEVTDAEIRITIGEQEPQVLPNPYGFVPAVWVKHSDVGSDYGVPAFDAALPKIDELNSIASHTSDHIHKQVNSPRVLWTNGTVKSLFRQTEQEVDELDMDERRGVLLLKGTQGGNTETLVGNLDPATIVPLVREIIQEIERDYPELTLYEKLREQNIVSAPGARALVGDVEKRLSRACSNYDAASERLFGMALAIAGYRANLAPEDGGWATVSPRTQTFRSFNPGLYSTGELEVTILPRPLLISTSREKAEELQIRGQGISSLADTLPLRERLKWLGYKGEELERVAREQEQEQETKRKAALAQAKTQTAQSPAPPPQRQARR